MKFFVFALAFVPFVSYGSIKNFENRGFKQEIKSFSPNLKTKIPSYAVVFEEGMASCVVSTKHKPHLLPSFYPKQTTRGNFHDETYLRDSLNLPLCDQEQESQLVAQSKNMVMENLIKPTKVAAVTWGALALWGFVSQAVICGASYSGIQLISNEYYWSGGALLGLSFLLPGIKFFLLCGGAGSFVAFYESSEGVESIEDEINRIFQPQNNDHPYLRSVVSIYVGDNEEKGGTFSEIFKLGNIKGSGFFVTKNMVVTNYHVVESYIDDEKEEKQITIKLAKGLEVPVMGVVAVNAKRDLALLQVEGSYGDPVTIGDSDKLAILDTVIVAGNPLFLRNSISRGHVSQIQKQGDIVDIQYTSPTAPGHSGGALLLESTGELIGVPYKVILTVQNINFAIPSNDLKKFLKENNVTFLEGK